MYNFYLANLNEILIALRIRVKFKTEFIKKL